MSSGCVRWEAAALRGEVALAPIAQRLLALLPAPGAEDGTLVYLVISELFSNALEHGVLGLDSRLKESAEGYAGYYRLRAERLARLAAGYVQLTWEYRADPAGDRLTVTAEDSGPGFEPSPCAANELSGRGLLLLAEVCESVHLLGRGNRVRAVYRPAPSCNKKFL